MVVASSQPLDLALKRSYKINIYIKFSTFSTSPRLKPMLQDASINGIDSRGLDVDNGKDQKLSAGYI